MRVDWEDLNRPDQPGDYYFMQDMLIAVALQDIEIWEEHPDATFEMVPAGTAGKRKRYTLADPDYAD